MKNIAISLIIFVACCLVALTVGSFIGNKISNSENLVFNRLASTGHAYPAKTCSKGEFRVRYQHDLWCIDSHQFALIVEEEL